jgi:hypothetical protein
MKRIQDKSTVTIPRVYFEYLNKIRLMLEPDEDKSIETNQKLADLRALPLAHLQNHEQRLFFWKRLEAACASYSHLVSRDRKKIEADIKSRDNERFADAISERSKPKAPKTKAKAEAGSYEREAIKNETKEEKALRKAIAGMVALGMSESEAKKALGIGE